jgi:hypothetical protein
MPKWVEIDKKAMAFGRSCHGKKNRIFWFFSHGCLMENLYCGFILTLRMPIVDFRQVVFALLLIIACSACKSDKQSRAIGLQPMFSNEIKQLSHDIAAENVLMGVAVGIAAVRPEQWDRYEKLAKLATDEELMALTNDTNAVVRCYAFQALLERRHIDPFHVLLLHLSDTANVHTRYGCIGNIQKVGDFYLACINTSSGGADIRRLNKTQQKIVDSMLIFGNNDLVARDELLNRLPVEHKYYSRVRGLVINENSLEAMIGLAKFKRRQDIPLIKDLLDKSDSRKQYYGLAAVVNFPDSEFFPLLKQIAENEMGKETYDNRHIAALYEAIVQYKNEASRVLLEKVIKEVSGKTFVGHADLIFQALLRYPDSVYSGIDKLISRRLMAKGNRE